MNILYLSNIAQLICAIIITVNYRNVKNTTERYFLHFLWLTILTEALSIFLAYGLHKDNFWLSNLWMVTSLLFYLFWFENVLVTKKQKIIKFIFLGVLFSIGLGVLFEDLFNELSKIIFSVGSISIVACCMLYFLEIIQNRLHEKLTGQPQFWITTALLTFNTGMLPLVLLSDKLKFDGTAYFVTITVLNILLYGFFIIAFTWGARKK